MQVLTNKPVITRKEHRCFSCRIVYPAGTKMRYQSNIYEGDFGSLYTCEGCHEVTTCFRDIFFDDEGVTFEGMVRESMQDEKVNTPEELLIVLRNKKPQT